MWLHVPKQFMGSASARESEASTSASALPSESDIELPLMLNNALTVRPPSWRGWQTRPWIRLLWPTISQVLTANRGAERFRSSLPDCPANPIAFVGASEDTQTLEHSGKTTPARCPTHSELSESVCPPWCFSKTSQAGFDFLDLSEKSWQDWATGLRQDGVKPDHIMVYMLIGYWPDETHEDRDARRKAIREFGARPYPMPFIRTPELVGFQRWCIFAWDKTMPWSYFESMHYGNRGRMYDDPRKVDKDIQLNLPRLERNEWPAA